MATMEIGVFLPNGSNGYMISTTSPQYLPTWELNKQIIEKAEEYDFEFAVSMVKLRGFGGKSQFWDHCQDSFTLMTALAAVTSKIRLIASTAVLTLPPAIAARMASTIDSIAPGRFGINIVSGWQALEYSQMGLWPGDEYFGYRYDYATEYVQVMKELWKDGVSNFKGKYFQMNDCKLSPRPKEEVKIIAAGKSGRGVEFSAMHADYNFTFAVGVNTPTAYGRETSRLVEAAARTGRDVGSYVLFMLIADETDEAAEAKWKLYNEGADAAALAAMNTQTSKDSSTDPNSITATVGRQEGAINLNMGTLVGSYEKVAAMLDEAAGVPGTKGILLAFDDYLQGMDMFGQKIQPLMKTRQGKA